MTSRNILRVDSSSSVETSASRQLCDWIIAHLGREELTKRDLAANPLPIVSSQWVLGRMKAPTDRTAFENNELALSDVLVTEFLAADIVVIGVPIYNFGIPAALKAWIDLIVRPGLTIQFTAEGVQPLVHGKRVILAVASASTAVGSTADFASTYLRQILEFIGVTELEVVAADQLAFDRDNSLARAKLQVSTLAL